jgi:uncharacterized membrane protein YbhN (UPF0104 family)
MQRWKHALKWGACLVAVAIFVRTLAGTDLRRAGVLIAHAGPAVLVIALPYLAGMALDTIALRGLLAALDRRASYLGLLRVRLSTEAINLALPAGTVVAESLNPILFKRHCGVPANESLAAMGAKKWLQMRAHAMYIALSFAVGYGLLAACSARLIGASGLPWIVLASAAVPLALSYGMSFMFVRGKIGERLLSLLARLPWGLGAKIAGARDGFAATDASFGKLGAAKAPLARANALLLATWLLESIESFLILRILGAPVGLAEVMAFEAGLSLVRCLAFFSPSGLGVQDLAYLAFLSAMGIPDAGATGAAFVILKRAKELCWIAVGMLLFVMGGSQARRSLRKSAATGT